MDPIYPLEVVCSRDGEPSQLIFALHAIELLPARIDCSVAAAKQGLIVRAETEVALHRHLELLESIYGERLRVSPLRVVHREGEEPFMAVRVRCVPACFGAVKADLLERGAVIVDEELSPARGVLRAVAPLTRLLGYSRHLRSITGDGALEVMWFSHYAQPQSPSLKPTQRTTPDTTQRGFSHS